MTKSNIKIDPTLLISIVMLIIGVLAVTAISAVIMDSVVSVSIPFDTDEADHANAGIELYAAVHKSPSDIASAITRQSFYPPIHSFAVAASYLFLGVGTEQSRIPSVVFYCFTAFVLSIVSYRVSKHAGFQQSSSLLSVASVLCFLAASPIVAENAALCMLELCGIFLTSLVLLAAASSIQGSFRALYYSVLVMLTKYSFGILVFPGILFGAMFRGSRPTVTLSSLLHATVLGVLFFLSFGIWCLVSDWPSIFHFFVGHPTYAPLLSAENLLFDVRSWIFEYSANPLSSIIIAVCGLYAARELWAHFVIRACVGILLSGLFILGLSTTNESRHFIVVAPALWLLGSLGVGHLWNRLQTNSFKPLTLLLFVPFLYGSWTLQGSLPQRIVKEMEGKPEFTALQDTLISVIDCSQPVLFVGVSDQFGIEALRWKGAAACNSAYTQIRFDTYPYRDDKNRTALKRKRNLDTPYVDTEFPKDPFEAILAKDYYRAVVLIRDVGARGATPSLIKSLKETFTDAKQVQITEGGKEITIVLL